jgi:hypothetical protein
LRRDGTLRAARMRLARILAAIFDLMVRFSVRLEEQAL